MLKIRKINSVYIKLVCLLWNLFLFLLALCFLLTVISLFAANCPWLFVCWSPHISLDVLFSRKLACYFWTGSGEIFPTPCFVSLYLAYQPAWSYWSYKTFLWWFSSCQSYQSFNFWYYWNIKYYLLNLHFKRNKLMATLFIRIKQLSSHS